MKERLNSNVCYVKTFIFLLLIKFFIEFFFQETNQELSGNKMNDLIIENSKYSNSIKNLVEKLEVSKIKLS